MKSAFEAVKALALVVIAGSAVYLSMWMPKLHAQLEMIEIHQNSMAEDMDKAERDRTLDRATGTGMYNSPGL